MLAIKFRVKSNIIKKALRIQYPSGCSVKAAALRFQLSAGFNHEKSGIIHERHLVIKQNFIAISLTEQEVPNINMHGCLNVPYIQSL